MLTIDHFFSEYVYFEQRCTAYMYFARPYIAIPSLRCISLLLLLSFGLSTKGQQLNFDHLTVENGLPSNSVLSITQDKKGFIWLGTRSGLSRYDGARLNRYFANSKDSNSLSGNNITTLLCDSKNNLWAGSAGLDWYDSKLDRFHRIGLGNRGSIAINCIFEDSKGELWVGTSNGIYIIDPKTKKTVRSYSATGAAGIADNNVRCIFEDRYQTMWIGTSKGLTRMKRKHNGYAFETFHYNAAVPGSLSADYITSIAEDTKGNLWIGTQNNGINFLEQGSSSFVHYKKNTAPGAGLINNNIRKVLFDRNGMLWIGTQEGLSLLDPGTRKFLSYQNDAGNSKSLSQNSIYSLCEDRSGSIWIGTYFGGANITHSTTTRFQTIQKREDGKSINNNVISSIREDNNKHLWIGTEGGGLNYYNSATGRYIYYLHNAADTTSLASNLVKVVYIDKEQNVWCGTHGGGLNVYDRKKNRFRRYLYSETSATLVHLEVTSLAEDNQGRFWAVTNNGLRVFIKKGIYLEPVSLQSIGGMNDDFSATYVYNDRNGNVWIGAPGGVFRIAQNKLHEVNSDLGINSLMEDEKGDLWAAVSDGGIAKYDQQSGKFVRDNQVPALKNIQVIGLLEDETGILWLSTDKGLTRYDRQESSIRIYTISDGLAGNEFNSSFLKTKDGGFFFGGYNGITHFYPYQIEANSFAAPVVFTGLQLFNNPVAIGGEDKLLVNNIAETSQLSFRHDQNVFTIEFALLNFIKSNKNKYAYRLEGLDKAWNETNLPSITYTNLPAGSYTFWIKAANNDGIWSSPVAMKIKILPPFWRTWWAYCIYAFVAAGILFLVIRFFFLRALLKKEDELHQVKLNFFTNVSHEIRTHLTLIMAPVEKMLEQKQREGFDHQQLIQVKSNADRLLKLVSELMDFRKAETDHLQLNIQQQNLVPFLQDIYTCFRDISLAKNIRTAFVHDTEEVLVDMDKEQLEKVFFNLLANAFKFTAEGGHILVRVSQEKNNVRIQVRDNGLGIDPVYQKKLFTNFFQVADHGLQNTGYGIGLALSKKIVTLHKGEIEVESEPAVNGQEGRTCFTVTLPISSKPKKENTVFIPAGSVENQKTIVPITAPHSEDADTALPTLLVVEDNPEIRQLIQEALAEKYRILLTENGEQGWDIASSEIPDIIISDVMMPVMDGFALCKQLKTDERTSHIPVILLTAKSTQNDQVNGLETGADSYITKPFSTKVLALQVQNLLQLRDKLRRHITSNFFESKLEEPAPANKEVAANTGLRTIDQEFLTTILQIIETNIDNPEFGVDMLSRKAAMSAPILYKKLKAVTGLSVNDFVKSVRLRKAASLLATNDHTVYEVVYAVGYNDRKHFSKEFKKQFGITPSEYSAKHKTGQDQS